MVLVLQNRIKPEMKHVDNGRQFQKGSVLIIVMVMLLLLTIAGTWAIRSSLTSLNITTNTQAQSLLMQNSDAVFFALEGQTSNELKLANMRIGDGILAYALRPENKNKELVFCFRSGDPEIFLATRNASVIYWQGGRINNSDMGGNGFCQINRLDDFISKRAVVQTQISIRPAPNIEDWEHLKDGDDKDTSKSQNIQRVVITATSILPSLTDAKPATINGCLNSYTSFNDSLTNQDSVTDCLAKAKVPYSTQQMEYTLRTIENSAS